MIGGIFLNEGFLEALGRSSQFDTPAHVGLERLYDCFTLKFQRASRAPSLRALSQRQPK